MRIIRGSPRTVQRIKQLISFVHLSFYGKFSKISKKEKSLDRCGMLAVVVGRDGAGSGRDFDDETRIDTLG